MTRYTFEDFEEQVRAAAALTPPGQPLYVTIRPGEYYLGSRFVKLSGYTEVHINGQGSKLLVDPETFWGIAADWSKDPHVSTCDCSECCLRRTRSQAPSGS